METKTKDKKQEDLLREVELKKAKFEEDQLEITNGLIKSIETASGGRYKLLSVIPFTPNRLRAYFLYRSLGHKGAEE